MDRQQHISYIALSGLRSRRPAWQGSVVLHTPTQSILLSTPSAQSLVLHASQETRPVASFRDSQNCGISIPKIFEIERTFRDLERDAVQLHRGRLGSDFFCGQGRKLRIRRSTFNILVDCSAIRVASPADFPASKPYYFHSRRFGQSVSPVGDQQCTLETLHA